MSSTSETGHTKNVTNSKTLNTYLGTLGADYNPTKPSIMLPALQATHTDADKALTNIQNDLPAFSAAVDAQEAVYKPLNKLVTRMVRAYKSAIENPAEAETVIALQKKINGKPKKIDPKKEPVEGEEDPVSTSQLSYDNRQANFQLLVKTMAANSNYKPNETDLQIVTLQPYADDLKLKTEAVDTTYAPIVNARINRNKILYHPKTGLVPVLVPAVKDYIISVYGANSPQIRYINKLKFRGLSKK